MCNLFNYIYMDDLFDNTDTIEIEVTEYLFYDSEMLKEKDVLCKLLRVGFIRVYMSCKL